MSGPWENYQTGSGGKPWEKYSETRPSQEKEVTAPDEFFLNPYTGQMTSRELLQGQIQDDLSRKQTVPMMAAHGASLGTSDEAAWLAGRIGGKPKFGDKKDVAKFEMEKQRAFIDASREKFPYSTLAAEVGGGSVVPGAVFKDGARATSTLGILGKAAGSGGVTGGLYAVGEGEGVGRLRDAPVGMALGAAGGVISVPVGKVVLWAGRHLGKPVARLFSDRRYYTESGGLTIAGREALEALGHNPDDVSAAFAREFSEGVADAIPEEQAARAAEMGEFSIPAYKHNVTGQVRDAADFERARRGAAGSAAERRVSDAADVQFDASRKAVDTVATDIGGGVRGDRLDAATAVSNRLEDIRADEKAASKAVYEAADAAKLAIDADVAKGVLPRIETQLAADEIVIDSGNYPKAKEFLNILKRRGDGTTSVSLRVIDTYRKRLNRIIAKADEMDKAALTIIKDEYDAWIDDVVEAKLFSGDEAGLDELKKARGLWSEYAKKFRGKDAGSKFIQKMVDRDASPEDVMRWIFGSSKIENGKMTSNIAKTLKEVLGGDSPEWKMLRQAVLRQIAQKPGTENVLDAPGVIPWGPQKVSQNIFTFLDSPASRPLSEVMFTTQERAAIRRLGRAISYMVPPDGAVNHSNTAYESARMLGKAWEAMVSMAGFAQGGPAGAIAGREAARGANWLRSTMQGRRVTSGATRAKPIGLPASGAIGAVGVTDLLSRGQEERASPR